MKKFLIAVLAIAMIAGSVPASAGNNSDEIAIGILGGVLGGLVLGEILDGPGPGAYPVYVEPPPVVYEEEVVVPEPMQCHFARRKVWSDRYNQYVVVKKRVCY